MALNSLQPRKGIAATYYIQHLDFTAESWKVIAKPGQTCSFDFDEREISRGRTGQVMKRLTMIRKMILGARSLPVGKPPVKLNLERSPYGLDDSDDIVNMLSKSIRAIKVSN